MKALSFCISSEPWPLCPCELALLFCLAAGGRGCEAPHVHSSGLAPALSPPMGDVQALCQNKDRKPKFGSSETTAPGGATPRVLTSATLRAAGTRLCAPLTSTSAHGAPMVLPHGPMPSGISQQFLGNHCRAAGASGLHLSQEVSNPQPMRTWHWRYWVVPRGHWEGLGVCPHCGLQMVSA